MSTFGVATSLLEAIALGKAPGKTSWSKIGYCPSLTAGVNTDVWSYCATQPVYLFPTAAAGMVTGAVIGAMTATWW